MTGIERLEAQVLEMNNYNVSIIFDYLKTREDLYDKFDNEEKSIEEMYEFICNKAEKHMYNRVAMINDKVVFYWAVTYFLKSNEELKITKKEISKQTTAKKEVKEKENEIKKIETKKEEKNNEQISMF